MVLRAFALGLAHLPQVDVKFEKIRVAFLE